VHAVERFRLLQRCERRKRDHESALHVGRSRTAHGLRIDALEALERMIRLEHGIEMADQQHVPAAAWMLGDQVPGASERGAIFPAHLEPERFEARPQHIRDTAHAREIHRAAVDIDDLFQQCDRAALLGLDALHERALGAGRRTQRGSHAAHEDEEDRESTH
jgi:hypothetical protein